MEQASQLGSRLTGGKTAGATGPHGPPALPGDNDAAKTAARNSMSFCAVGLYQNGINGYAKALEKLGASN